jgi:hypothetical protein
VHAKENQLVKVRKMFVTIAMIEYHHNPLEEKYLLKTNQNPDKHPLMKYNLKYQYKKILDTETK